MHPAMDTAHDSVEDNVTGFPFEELWGETASAHTFMHIDYYEEMQAALQRGESLFTCPLPPSSTDEMGIEMDEDDGIDDGLEPDNHGIDISRKYYIHFTFTHIKLTRYHILHPLKPAT